jgi:hypothetical protein
MNHHSLTGCSVVCQENIYPQRTRLQGKMFFLLLSKKQLKIITCGIVLCWLHSRFIFRIDYAFFETGGMWYNSDTTIWRDQQSCRSIIAGLLVEKTAGYIECLTSFGGKFDPSVFGLSHFLPAVI